VKEGQRYINLNSDRYLFSSHQKGKGIEKLIKIITLAPTRGAPRPHVGWQTWTNKSGYIFRFFIFPVTK